MANSSRNTSTAARPHVYFYPVIGPGGARMTRDYPMVKDSEGEDHDHPHHRSLGIRTGRSMD